MTEHDEALAALARLAPVRDEDLPDVAWSPGARALLDEVVAPAPRRRSRRLPRLRLAMAAGVATAAAAALVATSGVTTQPAAAGIAFSTSDGYVVARVTDPAAAAEQLRAAFAQRGLNVELELVPASPSLVGTVVMAGGSGIDRIRTLHEGRCTTPSGGCPIGLMIPLDFAGHAQIALGRAARAGERFRSSGDAFAPGEALHCSRLRGMRVADAQKVIARRRLKATWRLHDDAEVSPGSAGALYVADATPMAAGEVLIGVSAARPEPLSPEYEEAIAGGCP